MMSTCVPRARTGWALLFAAGALAVAVYWIGRRLAAHGLDWADKASSVGSFAMAVAAVLLTLANQGLRWARGTAPPAPPTWPTGSGSATARRSTTICSTG